MARRKRRSSRRRNPLMLMNPLHHRLSMVGRRVSRRSRLARHSRGMLLNPVAALRLPAMKPVVMELAGVAVGFIAVKAVQKYVIPAAWSFSTVGQIGAKVGSIAAVYVVSGMVLKGKPELRKAILVGGIFSVAIELLNQYLPMAANMAGIGSMGYSYPSAPRPLGYQTPSAPAAFSGIGVSHVGDRR